MKVVTWNINGIRTFKAGIKQTLDSFDADVICVQETKVTRDLLDERTAIVEGYNSYFSFSRSRTGYSGVATFCKDSATPFAAEEGLTGRFVSHAEAVGCYSDQCEFSSEELQALDSEGRAVITQHKIRTGEHTETLTIINVYCPRADPERPERKQFKLQFYKLLQNRAEAIMGPGSHVIVLGDINTSHRPIDHCDPDDVENFEDHPGRKWLDGFLFASPGDEGDDVEEGTSPVRLSEGKFVDTFRHFHPTRTDAFTCWSARTGARQTNYGTRIDYIFSTRDLVEAGFLNADIMPEVEGSDHCPMWAALSCAVVPSPRCPALCTRYMPEFAGRQQKLLRFLVKVPEQQHQLVSRESSLPGSQEPAEIQENLNPQSAVATGNKRPANENPVDHNAREKKSKAVKGDNKPQGSLLTFFKPKSSTVPSNQNLTRCRENGSPSDHLTPDVRMSQSDPMCTATRDTPSTYSTEPSTEPDAVHQNRKLGPSKTCPDFWKSVLHGPPQPPLCKAHNEPCVLRTVKKAGPNLGRQFFVCCRPQGHASNPEARCNFFAWVEKRR